MQLYFFRHAESKNNLLYSTTNSWVGRSEDPWVTPRGEKQARLLADYLSIADLGLTHIYSSLLLRAAYTASIVSSALKIPHAGWIDLHENGGVYNYDPTYPTVGLTDSEIPKIGLAGKPRSVLTSLFPSICLPPEATENGWWNRPFEDRQSRPERANRVIKTLLDIHGSSADRVAFFSHAGFYNTFLRSILQMSVDCHVWLHLNNCAVSLIDFGEGDSGDPDTVTGETRIVYLNRTDYLPQELLT